MKQILIARHAEADPGGALPDRERRLTAEGEQTASRQGRLLAKVASGSESLRIQGIVTSPALRARRTADLLAAELATTAPGAVPVEAADALYNNSGEVVLRFLQRLPDDLTTVLAVGHLPWVAQLVSLLVTESRDLYLSYQPGTLACVDLDVTQWSEAESGHGTLRWLLPPMLRSS